MQKIQKKNIFKAFHFQSLTMTYESKTMTQSLPTRYQTLISKSVEKIKASKKSTPFQVNILKSLVVCDVGHVPHRVGITHHDS
jgi:hypothetical protein